MKTSSIFSDGTPVAIQRNDQTNASPQDVARASVLSKVALFSEAEKPSKQSDKQSIAELKARIREQDELIASLQKRNQAKGVSSEEYETLRCQLDAAAGWEKGAMEQIEQLRREKDAILRKYEGRDSAPHVLGPAHHGLELRPELADKIGMMEAHVTALEKLLLRASVGLPRQNTEHKSIPVVAWPPTPVSSGSNPPTPEKRDARKGRPPSGPNPEHIMKVLLPNLSRKIQEQEATIEQQQTIIVSLRQELDTVASELFDNRTEAEKMKETISRLRLEVKEATINLSDQSKELAEKKTTVIALQNEAKISLSRLADKDNTIEKLQARLASPQVQNAVHGGTKVDSIEERPGTTPRGSPPLQLQTSGLENSQGIMQPVLESAIAAVPKDKEHEEVRPPHHNPPHSDKAECKQIGTAVRSLQLPDLSSKYALRGSPRQTAQCQDQNHNQESKTATAKKENVRGGSHGWASTPERWSMFAVGSEIRERKAGGSQKTKNDIQAADGEEAASRPDENDKNLDNAGLAVRTKHNVPRARQSAPVTIGSIDSFSVDADAINADDVSSEAKEIEEAKEAIKALVEQSTYRAWDPSFKSTFRM